MNSQEQKQKTPFLKSDLSESDLRPGDILLCRADRSMASRLISWGTGSVYSHVAVVVSAKMSLMIESMPGGGVRGADIRNLKAEYDVFRIKQDQDYDIDRVIAFLVKSLNAKYDYAGVIFLGLLKVFSKFGFPLKDKTNRFQIERDYFCSELCYSAFKAGGLDIVPQIGEADTTSPGDIARSPLISRVHPL